MPGIRYKGQIYSGAASVGNADDVNYDNTSSGLTAENVQDAVDEIAENLNSIIYVSAANTNALTIPANGELRVKVSDITRSVPDGYSVVGIRSYTTGATSIVIRNILPHVSGANDTFVVLRNITSSAQNLPANGFNVTVTYLKTI